MRELAEISGFRFKHPVHFQSIDRDGVTRYLEARIREVVKPQEIRAEELTLKKFGFVPADFDLKKNTLDLLTEQAAAFYDFHRKRLFMTDWTSASLRDVALVHELAHALADQNFPLEKYTRKVEHDSEQSLAREAVVEGQATWLMTEVLARRAGRTLANQDTAHEMLKAASDSSGGQYPVYDRAPLFLRETLLFPYSQGMAFQQAVFQRDGKSAFAELFRVPPVSTHQILHPAAYFAGELPTSPKIKGQVKGSRRLVEGTLGELEHAILMRQYGSRETSDQIAPQWRGSSYQLLEHRATKRLMLLYASEWKDPASARDFFEAYQKVLNGKWKRCEVQTRSASAIAGEGDDGYFRLWIDGSRVRSEEGFADKR